MVSAYHFLLRCTPFDMPSQQIKEHQLHLLAPAKINSEKDAFGNTIHYGYLSESHDIFVIASNGIVECERYVMHDPKPHPHYKAETHLTATSKQITALNRSINVTGDHFAIAVSLCEALHNQMKYSTGATCVTTTAQGSFDLGKGVCQDFAHILIAMCRERGIYARYVVGLVVGTGETHAWVEVWCDGAWRAIDPTHNRVVEWGYIKLAHGRDAADCSVIRGSKRGLSTHLNQVRVVVEEL